MGHAHGTMQRTERLGRRGCSPQPHVATFALPLAPTQIIVMASSTLATHNVITCHPHTIVPCLPLPPSPGYDGDFMHISRARTSLLEFIMSGLLNPRAR